MVTGRYGVPLLGLAKSIYYCFRCCSSVFHCNSACQSKQVGLTCRSILKNMLKGAASRQSSPICLVLQLLALLAMELSASEVITCK